MGEFIEGRREEAEQVKREGRIRERELTKEIRCVCGGGGGGVVCACIYITVYVTLCVCLSVFSVGMNDCNTCWSVFPFIIG